MKIKRLKIEMEAKKIHHANVIAGRDGRDYVFQILENDLSFKTRGNPDLLLIESETFGIDEARRFGDWAVVKPLSGDIKASVIVARSITTEAQNALLKTLEEPPTGTYIFIIIESLANVLPTLLSRVRILEVPNSDSGARVDLKSDLVANKFLSQNTGGRLSLVNSLSRKTDKTDMQELLKNLEEIAYKGQAKPQDLKNILSAKVFASARGSSPKMLLEWLACVLK